MKKLLKNIFGVIAVSLLIVAIFSFFLTALNSVDEGKSLEDKTKLEDAMKKAALSCYAIEGAYPPSAQHLIENYAVQYDEERFVIKYEFYGSNLMPDITVLVRGK